MSAFFYCFMAVEPRKEGIHMNQKKSAAAVWDYTQGYRGRLTLAFAVLLGELLLSFVTPLVLSVTIDSVLGGMPLNTPWYFTWILNLCGGITYIRSHIIIMSVLIVVMAALSGGLSFLRPCLTHSAAFSIAQKISDHYYDHVQKLPFAYHAGAKTGDLIQRAISDIDTIRRFFSSQLLEFLRTLFLLVVGFFLMASLNLPLTLISFILFPVIVADSMVFIPKIDKIANDFEEQDGRVYTVIQENLTGMRVVRAFGREAFERDKLYVENEKLRAHLIAFNHKLVELWFSLDLLSGLQLSLITVVGVIFTATGRITLGQYTAFLAYTRIFLQPIQDFGKVLGSMTRTRIAVRRVEEIMAEPEEDPVANGKRPPLHGDITFNHVNFAYDSAPVFEDLSFTIHGGETIAILGGTGSGKTTLVSLLQRLYDPDSGCITIGGTDVQEIQKEYLRDRIGMVMQEPYLYSKTIGKNIGIKRSEFTPEEIQEAAKIACVHEDIVSFPEGYETVIGERGVTLSGGQKQRVAIARAIIAESDILIFDDALSAVDTQTDQNIRSALKQRRKGVTTIIISHRVSTLMEADRIFVLKGGKIAEAGTHEELLTVPDGIYRRVYEIQTSDGPELSEAQTARIAR